MPKSRGRKKDPGYIPDELAHLVPAPKESPKWLAPAMLAGFLIGLVWIVIYYVSNTSYPIPHVGAWNMLFGFGFIAAGFSLATRWK